MINTKIKMITFGQVNDAMAKRFPNSTESYLTDEERKILQDRLVNFNPELDKLLEEFVKNA
jgi:hypothetical protein